MPYAPVCFQEEAVLHIKFWFYKWEQPDECFVVLVADNLTGIFNYQFLQIFSKNIGDIFEIIKDAS